jgi:hypothetical protein
VREDVCALLMAVVFVFAALIIGCASGMPAFCEPEIGVDGKAVMMCRPATHHFSVKCWRGADGNIDGGEICHVGDGQVYGCTRIRTGNPLEGLEGAKCPK